jgi:hypothetical protein
MRHVTRNAINSACSAVLFGALALGPLQAQEAAHVPNAAKVRQAKRHKPPVNTGYGETRAERDKRLQRECRGKPNAGACEGYGS